MRIKQLLIGMTASVIAVSSYVEMAIADLKFPMLVYRTGAYAPNGIPNADGFVDYYKMINARDGGIGGEKILHPECETGYKTQVGVECYEKNKKDAMVFQPMSTGITYQLIPKATAVWLIDNTALTFEQIADFCSLHILEVKGIADGDVDHGIRGADPIAAGQLTRLEIEDCQKDKNARLKAIQKRDDLPEVARRVGKKYTPLSKRQDRPDSIFWLVRNHPELLDSQIGKLVGTTKSTIQSIRDRTHWNSANLTPVDPVSVGLCTQVDLDKAVQKAFKRIEKRKAEEAKKYESEGIAAPESVTNEQIQEINIEEKIEVTTNDAQVTSEENIEENTVPEEKKDQDEKEYTSDSVFAKLNELKKED